MKLVKSISNDDNRLKRINAQKISSLKELLNKPIKEVTFDINSIQQLDEISKFLDKTVDTLINIKIYNEDNSYDFQLKNRINFDRKSLNLLRNKEISAIIN